tara:strand:+ start:2132 stop:2686 length:555 start_codon:yes stop_codon:yes gene_type:complete
MEIKTKIKRNFDFEKARVRVVTVHWLNNIIGKRINKRIQDGIDEGVDINGNKFKKLEESTKELRSGNKPLLKTGNLRKTKAFPAKKTKLNYTLKSVAKAKKKYRLEKSTGTYIGTRKKAGYPYAKIHNEGYYTDKKSLVKKEIKVPKREWFGIPKSFKDDGKDIKQALEIFWTLIKARINKPMG